MGRSSYRLLQQVVEFGGHYRGFTCFHPPFANIQLGFAFTEAWFVFAPSLKFLRPPHSCLAICDGEEKEYQHWWDMIHICAGWNRVGQVALLIHYQQIPVFATDSW